MSKLSIGKSKILVFFFFFFFLCTLAVQSGITLKPLAEAGCTVWFPA